MQADSQPLQPKCLGKKIKTTRSAVSNGSKLLMADGRSTWSKRFRDIVAMHCEDLGGYENLSQAELAIIRRAATLEVELEAKEAALANGEAKIDLMEFAAVSNGLRRLLETVGLKRVVRQNLPSLRELMTGDGGEP